MKFTTIKKLLTPSTVKISGASITEVAGDSHTHYGDIYNKISSHAGFPWPTILDCVSMGAAYDSRERVPAPRCLPGTRRGVLEKIETWVKAGSEGTSILWLHGPAGAGKSAIAQTVAETCARRDELAASFFFARTVASRNAMTYLFPTIAVQIALSAPERRQRLDGILMDNPCIVERASGSVDLVASLFPKHSALVPSSPSLVVIDGLDECHGHDDQCRILAQLSDMVNTYHPPLRFLIISRPESHLCEAFEEPALANISERLSLYGDFQALDDVSTYLRSEFSRIYDSKRHRDVMEFVPKPWPPDETIHRLVSKSGGYFIYASTVIKFIDEEYFSPADRLDQVLDSSNLSLSPSDLAPFSELDKLYFQILSSCPTSKLPIFKHILGYVASDESGRLVIDDIEGILHLPRGQVKLMLRGLRSFVTFGEPIGLGLRLNHASFVDFLHDKDRSKVYHVDSEEWMYTAFCDTFSLGCNILGLSADARVESTTRYPKGCDRVMLTKIQRLARFIRGCFRQSSRKCRLIVVVRESIEKGIWYPCLQDLDHWSDWERFAALELLLAVISNIGLQDDVENVTQATRGFVVQLRTICDSVLHAYFSKVADTTEKRHYLHALQAAMVNNGIYPRARDLFIFLHDPVHKLKVFDVHPSDFQPYDLSILLAIMGDRSVLGLYYMRDFSADPQRSKEFYHEAGLWITFVVTRQMRYLRTLSNSSLDQEILGWVTFYLAENMGNTMPNDADLLTEIQCFWTTEPPLLMSQISKLETSWLAVEVLRWLQRSDNSLEETMSLWKTHVIEDHLPLMKDQTKSQSGWFSHEYMKYLKILQARSSTPVVSATM